MRWEIARCVCGVLAVHALSAQTLEPPKHSVIAASMLLDGTGRTLRNTRVVIEGAKIVAIDPKAGPVDYDLRGLTVLPGWIDAHVHITWSFGKDGKNAGAGEATQEAAYRSAANAWTTLLAGLTTGQVPGAATGGPVGGAIAEGALPGARILVAIEAIQGRGEQEGTTGGR